MLKQLLCANAMALSLSACAIGFDQNRVPTSSVWRTPQGVNLLDSLGVFVYPQTYIHIANNTKRCVLVEGTDLPLRKLCQGHRITVPFRGYQSGYDYYYSSVEVSYFAYGLDQSDRRTGEVAVYRTYLSPSGRTEQVWNINYLQRPGE